MHDDSITQLRRAANAAPMLDASTEESLIREARDGSQRSLERLLASHLRLVIATARRYGGRGASMEDLVAEGNLGLLEAVHRFDVSRGTRFATYAAWWVRAFMRRYALANRRIVNPPSTRNARRLIASLRKTQQRISHERGVPASREDVADALAVPVEDVVMVEAVLGQRDVAIGPVDDGVGFEIADGGLSPEDQAANRQSEDLARAQVKDALSRLGERERAIVTRRMLDDDVATLAMLGQDMGLSRERIRQIEKRAQEKLRSALLAQVA